MPRLPPLALQRQPVGSGRRHLPGRTARREASHRYSYRFLFAPGTIGSITWLARNEDDLGSIKHGLVLAGLGRCRRPSPTSRPGAATPRSTGPSPRPGSLPGGNRIRDFTPYGYDERQYCSPGFNSAGRQPHADRPTASIPSTTRRPTTSTS